MTNEKLLKATENQIKMTDKLIVDLIREFQNYVDPGDEPLMTAPDLKDALTAVEVKERLLRLRSSLFWECNRHRGSLSIKSCKVDGDIKPEVTE